MIRLKKVWPKKEPEISVPPVKKKTEITRIPPHPDLRKERELVAGGVVLWEPINREAAKLLSKASWIYQPIYEKEFTDTKTKTYEQPTATDNHRSDNPKRKRKKKTMSTITIDQIVTGDNFNSGAGRITADGIRIKVINGEECLNTDDLHAFLVREIAKLPKETSPGVKAAQDARETIGELLNGIGGEMEKFRASCKLYLEDIRGTRFSVVTETSQMTTALKEVRHFFLGGDYKEEILRLKEFVDLCERLSALKKSGFLDSIADTMLVLAK